MPSKELPQKPHLRHTDDGNWFWCSKKALRAIRENIDNSPQVASCCCVYVALCEIANEKESEVFQTTHAFLSLRTGFSARTVRSRVADLRDLELIRVRVSQKKRGPSTYEMLSMAEKQAIQIGNGSRHSLPRSKDRKDPERRKVQGWVAYAIPTESDCEDHAIENDQDTSKAEDFWIEHEGNGWTTGRGKFKRRIKYWQPCQDGYMAVCEESRESI